VSIREHRGESTLCSGYSCFSPFIVWTLWSGSQALKALSSHAGRRRSDLNGGAGKAPLCFSNHARIRRWRRHHLCSGKLYWGQCTRLWCLFLRRRARFLPDSMNERLSESILCSDHPCFSFLSSLGPSNGPKLSKIHFLSSRLRSRQAAQTSKRTSPGPQG